MCGIAGFISKRFNNEDLIRMTDRIAHRGPDASGYYYDEKEGLGLGHRRLSIIDLSDSANQPFVSKSGRSIIVFNGEIYNFKDLKAKFNLSTRTNSDTEIIVELIERYGVEIVNEFNGMFAIALWDTLERKLTLIRDRIGKKPLYFSHSDGEFSFASEMKSLNALEPREKNLKDLAYYLHLGYMPGVHTFFKGIQKLESGHYLIFQEGKIEKKAYWKIEDSILKNKKIDESNAEAVLEDLLESAVKYRMIADVPLGTFLSGGIDSSLVTALAQKQKDSPIKTFSIGFKEGKFNESNYAAQVAKHLKTDHHEFVLTKKDAQERIALMLELFDEPYIDSSAVPSLLVSEMARKHVTVALTGDGGDELFMGYGMYDWARRLDTFPFKSHHDLISKIFKMSGSSRFMRIGDLLTFNENTFMPAHIFSQEQYLFSTKEISDLCLKPSSVSFFDMKSKVAAKYSPAEMQSLFDFKYYLQEDLNVKVDRASMHHALETRAPLLDYRIAEFAFSLPEHLRKKENVSKYLLKKILYKHVPKEIFDRPKWGFSIPLGEWLAGDLNYLIQDYLNKEIVEKHHVVFYAKVDELITRFMKGESYIFQRLWALILLHMWLEKLDNL